LGAEGTGAGAAGGALHSSYCSHCIYLRVILTVSVRAQACKDHQLDPDFCVVARVEAFIAGWGLDEALRRAEAYVNAGADAILMHSKRNDPSEIEAFMKVWKNQGPVIVVPTKYFDVPTRHLQDMGVSVVIWANHNLRASVTAMKEVCDKIHAEQSIASVEQKVVQVKEIFRLQNDEELQAAEKKYLPEY
ncbi:PREDICTED: phosphoenolpyruvate phosphomutase-like, partial [Priapulus caudatus]|uniref:Phosphoenolpyruvate phosphomutase-like n=1 Tax=Priapulus caudatus TaxID=37621 RepID=A0ABM1F0G3_PRICU